MTEPSDLQDPTSDASRPPPGVEATKTDVLGSVADTIELGGFVVDAAAIVVQAGGVAVEAGAATLKVAAAGAESIGALVGGILEGL